MVKTSKDNCQDSTCYFPSGIDKAKPIT